MTENAGRRAQILRAAFAEFANKGFNGTTIKSIAQAAHLRSPALIYWYFPSKEELFQAALAEHAPILRAFGASDLMMEQPPAEVLPRLAQAFLETASDPIAQQLVRMVLSEGRHRDDLTAVFLASGPLRVLDMLAAYLQRQVDLGRLRAHDTALGARAFVGMLLPQAMSRWLLPGIGTVADESSAAVAVDIFLQGLSTTSR